MTVPDGRRPATAGDQLMERYVTKRELAELWSVSIAFIDKHMRHSGLPHHKLRGMVRFRVSEVEAWARERS